MSKPINFEFLFGRSVLNLPGVCIPLIASASAEQLRVLIGLASENGKTLEGLAALADTTEDHALAAIAFWEKNGVITLSEELSMPTAPTYAQEGRAAYTGADMERISASGEMQELLAVCSAIFGKTFTPTETESLFYLYDGLRLEFEYIVRLCKYCHDIGKASLRYLEKVAISLYDGGSVTVGALEAYIEKEERKNDMEFQIRMLFGIGERALTPKEKEYLSAWVIDWNFSYEIIEMAYNQMMSQIPQPKFSYENGILKRWAEAGCRTKEDVEKLLVGDKKARENAKQKEKEQNIGFDLDEFFAAATLRGEESSGS
ncbi:MAG: DnaD domain protein [Clostridia bacterium]|nr:DnaD domain protein [Clostridia bacterium]